MVSAPQDGPVALPRCSFQHQDSRHGALIGVRSWVGFHAVAQSECGAGVNGVGGVENLAEFGDEGGVAWCGQRAEPNVQGVVAGDDVAGAAQSGADEGVDLLVGAHRRCR